MNKRTPMTLIEPVNINNLKLILKNFNILQQNKYSLWTNKEGEHKHKNLIPILNKYLKSITNSKVVGLGFKQVDYIPSIKKQLHGRIYPKNSEGLIAFPKYIRNFILTDTKGKPLVIDIDIKNAHPTIYYQFLEKDGYDMTKINLLNDYNTNRDEWVQMYPDIKNIVICALNSAQYFDSLDNKQSALIQQIWQSQQWIKQKYDLENLTELKEFIYNKNCEIEREIIELAFKFFKSKNIEPQIYAYDGFCIENTENNSRNIRQYLKELNQHVWDILEYKVEFVCKPIQNDKRLIEILENSERLLQLENTTKIKLKPGQFISDYFGSVNILTDDIKEDIIVFKGAMGDGKTWYLYKCLRTLGHDHVTAISILNRISLVGNVCFDYDFVNSYLEDDTKSSEKIDGYHKTTAICCESLHRFTPETLQNCDYLILDEFMSILTQFQSIGTHKGNLSTNQNIFWGLIRKVKKVIILDANVEKSTIDFIKFIRGEKSQVVSYQIEARKEKEIQFTGFPQLMPFLISEVIAGKKFVIPITQSIIIGNQIKAELENARRGVRVLYLNRDTKDEYDIYIRDTSKWAEFDVVMYSPTISSGVSCVVKDHFDFVACFFTSSTCNAYESGQMVGRLRTPKTNKIYIVLETKNVHPVYNKYPMNRKDLLKHLYMNQYDLFNKHKIELDKKFNFETFREEIVCNERMELFLHTTEFQLYQYKSYKLFLDIALENSYICDFKPFEGLETWITTDGKAKDELREFGESVKFSAYERDAAIITSEPCTDEEALILEREMKTDCNEYKKYQLLKKSCIPKLDERVKTITHKSEALPVVVQAKIYRSVIANDIPAVKKIKRILNSRSDKSKGVEVYYGLNPLLEETKTPDTDILIDEDITFQPIWNDTLIYRDMTAEQCRQIWKADMTKVYYTEMILKKFFGSKFLWHAVQLTNEEYMSAKFELYKWVMNPKNYVKHGGEFKYTMKKRLENLFDINIRETRIRPEDTWETFFKPERRNDQVIDIQKILSCCNLSFNFVGKRKQVMKNGVREEVVRSRKLSMNQPLILDERYPHNITIDAKKLEKGWNKDWIPTIYNKPKQRLILQNVQDIPPVDLELYKQSVFYNVDI